MFLKRSFSDRWHKVVLKPFCVGSLLVALLCFLGVMICHSVVRALVMLYEFFSGGHQVDGLPLAPSGETWDRR